MRVLRAFTIWLIPCLCIIGLWFGLAEAMNLPDWTIPINLLSSMTISAVAMFKAINWYFD